jgi:hypothetical protein
MTNHLWTTVRDELRERREARAHEHALRRELSAYTSPAEIEGLLATLEHQDAEGAASKDAPVIRTILLDNLRAHYARAAAPRTTVAGL